MREIFNKWIVANRIRLTEKFLSLLQINTVSPNEGSAYEFIKNYVNEINFKAKKEFLHKDLRRHKLFTNYPMFRMTTDRFNIKILNKTPIVCSGKKVLFNIHLDTVPKTEKFPVTSFKNGFIYGRGACDSKNNIIMLVEAIRFLIENNIVIKKQIEINLVIEEEIGGNGTLSSILNGIKADLIIVMEPTSLLVYRGHRGCITAEIEVKGKSVHMGSDETGVNAIECMVYIMNSLKKLELKMLKEASSDKAYKIWKKPLQINFGKIFGGEWPGSVAEKCTLISNIGFLPNYSIQQAEVLVDKFCHNTEDEWTNRNTRVKFNSLHNNAYIINENDRNIKEMLFCLNKWGINQSKSFGWKVSCDARLYFDLLNIPTLIFGCGDLGDAHSSHEKISLKGLEFGIGILADYLSRP